MPIGQPFGGCFEPRQMQPAPSPPADCCPQDFCLPNPAPPLGRSWPSLRQRPRRPYEAKRPEGSCSAAAKAAYGWDSDQFRITMARKACCSDALRIKVRRARPSAGCLRPSSAPRFCNCSRRAASSDWASTFCRRSERVVLAGELSCLEALPTASCLGSPLTFKALPMLMRSTVSPRDRRTLMMLWGRIQPRPQFWETCPVFIRVLARKVVNR
jgi:hypothetical protein